MGFVQLFQGFNVHKCDLFIAVFYPAFQMFAVSSTADSVASRICWRRIMKSGSRFERFADDYASTCTGSPCGQAFLLQEIWPRCWTRCCAAVGKDEM